MSSAPTGDTPRSLVQPLPAAVLLATPEAVLPLEEPTQLLAPTVEHLRRPRAPSSAFTCRLLSLPPFPSGVVPTPKDLTMPPLAAFCAAGVGLPLGAYRGAQRVGRGVTMGAPLAGTPPPSPPSPAVSRRSALLAAAAVAAAAVATPPPPAEAISIGRLMKKAGPEQVMEGSGIRYREVIIGKGFEPNPGDTVAIHYSLYCRDIEVESSRESQGLAATPVGFTFGAESGAGAVIKGINLGTLGCEPFGWSRL